MPHHLQQQTNNTTCHRSPTEATMRREPLTFNPLLAVQGEMSVVCCKTHCIPRHADPLSLVAKRDDTHAQRSTLALLSLLPEIADRLRKAALLACKLLALLPPSGRPTETLRRNIALLHQRARQRCPLSSFDRASIPAGSRHAYHGRIHNPGQEWSTWNSSRCLYGSCKS